MRKRRRRRSRINEKGGGEANIWRPHLGCMPKYLLTLTPPVTQLATLPALPITAYSSPHIYTCTITAQSTSKITQLTTHSSHLPLTLHSSLPTLHPSLVIPHPSPLTPHPPPLTPHSSPLTPHPSLLTLHSSPLTDLHLYNVNSCPDHCTLYYCCSQSQHTHKHTHTTHIHTYTNTYTHQHTRIRKHTHAHTHQHTHTGICKHTRAHTHTHTHTHTPPH